MRVLTNTITHNGVELAIPEHERFLQCVDGDILFESCGKGSPVKQILELTGLMAHLRQDMIHCAYFYWMLMAERTTSSEGFGSDQEWADAVGSWYDNADDWAKLLEGEKE